MQTNNKQYIPLATRVRKMQEREMRYFPHMSVSVVCDIDFKDMDLSPFIREIMGGNRVMFGIDEIMNAVCAETEYPEIWTDDDDHGFGSAFVMGLPFSYGITKADPKSGKTKYPCLLQYIRCMRLAVDRLLPHNEKLEDAEVEQRVQKLLEDDALIFRKFTSELKQFIPCSEPSSVIVSISNAMIPSSEWICEEGIENSAETPVIVAEKMMRSLSKDARDKGKKFQRPWALKNKYPARDAEVKTFAILRDDIKERVIIPEDVKVISTLEMCELLKGGIEVE